ncbi:MAG TPA: NfeD family protein [Candidatus Dormibacteraeota bacterium]|nr:NfeD family protein [Candidatus Dormibacteraeota bacterium]
MGNWVNWLLVIAGVVCVIVELALGAVTGFDLALIGGSLAIGGGIGLSVGSEKVGLIAAGGLALVYLAVFRRWLRSRLTVKDRPTNVDAVVGKMGVVTKRIAPREPGMVKLGDEVWRAELVAAEGAARDPGATVQVESVEGVTLKVR